MAVGAKAPELTRQEQARRARDARSKLPPSTRPTAGPDRDLFEALRAWRRAEAAAADVPAFVIFNDATLAAVAEHRPTTMTRLLDVPGIGPVKAERFGRDLLRLVSEAPGQRLTLRSACRTAPDGPRATPGTSPRRTR